MGKLFLFVIALTILLLYSFAEPQPNCPNRCTTRRRARRQCRRREGCEVVPCQGRERACAPEVTPVVSVTPSSSFTPTPSQSPSTSPSQSPSASPSSSVSPTPSSSPSVSSTPSATPSITPSPSPTPIINTLSDVGGVTCPAGTSPGPFGGAGCDLNSLRVRLAVGPSSNFGFPARANCPGNPVAGGGAAGCTFCGDDTSDSVRELLIFINNGNAGCDEGIALVARIGEYLEATAIADGVQICPRDFDVDDGGSYITETLASKFQDIVNAALCSPNSGFFNTLSDVSGVLCPTGTSPGPFGGASCDLNSLRVRLAVGPSSNFGFPARANCPGNPVAGGGAAGCTFCGDDTSDSVRELLIFINNGNAGCDEGIALTRSLGESLEAAAVADGVTLCPRDFEMDDGGAYVTQVLPTRLQDIMNNAFCV